MQSLKISLECFYPKDIKDILTLFVYLDSFETFNKKYINNYLNLSINTIPKILVKTEIYICDLRILRILRIFLRPYCPLEHVFIIKGC